MALQFVGATSGTGTSNGYSVSLSGTLTGGIASSPAAGDIVVVVSAFGNTASSAPAVSGNNSGAYTGFQAAVNVNDTWDTEFRTFYAVMGGTPDTTLTITRATNTAYGGATVVMVYRGQNTSSPIAFNSTVATITNGSRAVTPSATLTATDQWVVSFGAGTQGTTGSAFTVPAELTGNSRSVNADGSTSDIGVWAADRAPGITGTFTISAPTGGTTSTSSSGAAHTIVLSPQPTVVTHGTTGALVGQGSTVAGSATRIRAFATSGALAGQGSTIVGSADRSTVPVVHATSGALVGQGSVVSGSANRFHVFTSSGDLVGQGATLSGAAARTRLHDTAGLLVGDGSLLSGFAQRNLSHDTSGALIGPGAIVVGVATGPYVPPVISGESRFIKAFVTNFAS